MWRASGVYVRTKEPIPFQFPFGPRTSMDMLVQNVGFVTVAAHD